MTCTDVPALNGGLVSYYGGNRLKSSESQVAVNVFLDQDAGVVKRGGQTLYGNIAGCTAQVRAEAEYDSPAGQAYMLVACGNHVYVSLGTGSFAVLGGTISTTANVYFAQGMGFEWVTDGTDALWSTNGVTVSSYPYPGSITATGQAPLGQLVSVFQNRLALANVSGGQSAVYLAGYNSGSVGIPIDFTLPSVIVDTSAAIFGLNGLNDGLQVTCMSSAFRNVLILWDHNFMYGLYGSGYSTFILRELAEIGCDEQQSVQEFDGQLRWLSQFGVYQYDGLNTKRISDDVKDQITNIITTEPGSLSITQDQQSDWAGGNLTASGAGAPMSDTIDIGNVVPSTFGPLSQNTTNQFALWTPLSPQAPNVLVCPSVHCTGTAGEQYIALTPNSINPGAVSTATYSPGFLIGFSTPIITCEYWANFIGDIAPVYSSMTIQFSSQSINGPWSTPVVCASTSATANAAVSGFISGSVSIPGNANFVSIGAYAYSTLGNNAEVDITSFTLSGTTTGYFISSCFNTTPNTGWGLFQSDNDPGNGAVTYAVSTGTTCGAVQSPTATWTPQSNFNTISVATASYLGVQVLFSGMTYFASNDQPTLEDITINWQSSAGRPRTASQVFNNRYWLAFTTATSGVAFNNNVLVYDSLGHWSNFQGVNAASLATYQRVLYAGSSLGDGNVNVQNQGTSDFGNDIFMDFRSPDYELGTFNTVNLYDLSLEATQVAPPSTSSVIVQYYVDRDTTPYALGGLDLFNGSPGLMYTTSRFGAGSNPTLAHTLSYEVQDLSTAALTFYRGLIRYTVNDGP